MRWPDARLTRCHRVLDRQRLVDTNRRGVHDAGCCDQAEHERAVECGRPGDRNDPADRDRMIKARDFAAGRRLRQATRDAKLQRRAVTESGRTMFRNMPPVVRLRILRRLKKLAADAQAEITRARDHARLRAGMMKLMTLTAMIDAAHEPRGPATVTGVFPSHSGGASGNM
jgi:hypothetical protein